MLVGIVEGGADEGAHGPIHDNEVLVAVGLGARHGVDQRGGVPNHRPPGLQDHGQAQVRHQVAHCVHQIRRRREFVAPASQQKMRSVETKPARRNLLAELGSIGGAETQTWVESRQAMLI